MPRRLDSLPPEEPPKLDYKNPDLLHCDYCGVTGPLVYSSRWRVVLCMYCATEGVYASQNLLRR
jgi:hypothetical protein